VLPARRWIKISRFDGIEVVTVLYYWPGNDICTQDEKECASL
jgi:hypothetical protein